MRCHFILDARRKPKRSVSLEIMTFLGDKLSVDLFDSELSILRQGSVEVGEVSD